MNALLLMLVVMRPEVVDAAASGFTLRHEVRFDGDAAMAYAALIDVGSWWHPDHTYGGDSKKLSLDARAGGCFCETLPDGGSVQHMEVVYAAPGKMLRLRGGLGPLQGMGVDGAMTFALEAKDGATTITLTYAVGGYYSGGLETLAPPVDGVLAQQVERLAAAGTR